MIDPSLLALAATAAGIAVTHTLAGPDHYVPFIAMARIGRWSRARTAIVTILCGVGHVLSSVALGLAAVALGKATGVADWIMSLEDHRGRIAGWLLMGFGVAYAIWGLRRAVRNRPHAHWHMHADGTYHCHEHKHHADHAHLHVAECGPVERASLPAVDCSVAAAECSVAAPYATAVAAAPYATAVAAAPYATAVAAAPYATAVAAAPYATQTGADRSTGAKNLTPWVLFTIFVFGPCEPLIPLLMIPAAQVSLWGLTLITSIFLACTVATMLTMVLLGDGLLARLRFIRMDRMAQPAAGLALAACGLAVVVGL